MTNRTLILGAKYFILDKILNEVLEVQITQLNDVELSYKNLTNNIKGIEFYRELEDIEIKSILDTEEAQRLNNQSVFSTQTDFIKAIIGREEIIKYSLNDFKELNKDENSVLISITDPDKKTLPLNILNSFKDSLSTQFWDIEEDEKPGGNKKISQKEADIIHDFILKNKNNNFIIHCEAGISRSAGVGLATSLICEFNGDKYLFATSPNKITTHHRYHPNWAVYDMISNRYD